MTTYTRLSDKPFESHYLFLETTLDHPIAKVWPKVLDIAGWMNAHVLQTLDGEAGAVGHFERVLPRDLPEATPTPHHHLYGVAAIIPERYIALEVLPERGGSYGNAREWVSFDGLILTDLGDRTNLVFLMIDVNAEKGDAEFEKEQEAKLEEGRRLLNLYFDNLKASLDA